MSHADVDVHSLQQLEFRAERGGGESAWLAACTRVAALAARARSHADRVNYNDYERAVAARAAAPAVAQGAAVLGGTAPSMSTLFADEDMRRLLTADITREREEAQQLVVVASMPAAGKKGAAPTSRERLDALGRVANRKGRAHPYARGGGGGGDDDDDDGTSGLYNNAQQQRANPFMSASRKLRQDERTRNGRGRRGNHGGGSNSNSNNNSGGGGRSLGGRKRFVSPVQGGGNCPSFVRKALQADGDGGDDDGEEVDERLKNIDPKHLEVIENEILDRSGLVTWDDIAGLSYAKQTVQEIIVWPLLRPDIFTGLRGPPKGLLLFGPPGTGKTMIGKAIASSSKSTFFSISASSLMSKWAGEGERLCRALFAVAAVHQPSVIFIDEIDSLLSARSDGEFEGSRRLKTEFLVQMDGAATREGDRILLIGATNRPQELDEAARRRMVKRLYIPLPDDAARNMLVRHLMEKQAHKLGEADFARVVERSRGYSGSDLHALCTEAAMGPIRSITDIQHVTPDSVRPIVMADFASAFKTVRPSVSAGELDAYIEWNARFGSFGDAGTGEDAERAAAAKAATT